MQAPYESRFTLWWEAYIDFRITDSRERAKQIWRDEAKNAGLEPGRFQPLIRAEDAPRTQEDLLEHPGDPYRTVWRVKGVVSVRSE